MKKLSLLSNLAIILGFATLILSCQKQQDAVKTTTTTTSTDAAVIRNVSGDGSPLYHGQITLSDASELVNTYKKSNTGNGPTTEYVSFSIADLQAYLDAIKANYKSDIIYVNFGVYDQNTAPDPSLIGRTTCFFSGNNNNTNTHHDNHVGFGISVTSNALMNHGNVYP